MRVCEDGGAIQQASRADSRTPALALHSPHLAGRTAAVHQRVAGPHERRRSASHAVAHNEEYRKLIKGYMRATRSSPASRLAQVNGLRGETATLDKMRARVQYDIDYMRNWSLMFDLMIIAKTLLVVWRDKNAY